MSILTFEAVASVAAGFADADTLPVFVVTAVAAMALIATRLLSASREVED